MKREVQCGEPDVCAGPGHRGGAGRKNAECRMKFRVLRTATGACRQEAGTLQNAELSGGRRGSLSEVSVRFPGSRMGKYSLMFAYVRLCSLFWEKNV